MSVPFHCSALALPLFSVSDLGTLTYLPYYSIFLFLKCSDFLFQEAFLDCPCLGERPSFVPTTIHTSPSTTLTVRVPQLPNYLSFCMTRLSKQGPNVSILVNTYAPFIEKGN